MSMTVMRMHTAPIPLVTTTALVTLGTLEMEESVMVRYWESNAEHFWRAEATQLSR